MKWLGIFYLPFVAFIESPLAALIPAGVLAGGFLYSRKAFVGVIAALWALYAVYESLMKARVLCSGECNIRVDLLVIAPALCIMTVIGLVKMARKKRLSDGAA